MRTALLALMAAAPLAPADLVDVRIYGEVEYNQVRTGPFAPIVAGDDVVMAFRLDSSVFTNSPNFPVRGYEIDRPTFALSMGPVTVGLQNPMQATPYFAIRNNDPQADGFLVSTVVDFPVGVPTSVSNGLGPFIANFYVSYGGDLLGSLDLLGAQGEYDFDGLTVFNFTIDNGPANPIGIVFERMTILAAPPACDADVNCDGSPDQGDVACMILAVAGESACICQDPDFNADGSADQGDVAAHIGVVAGQPCP